MDNSSNFIQIFDDLQDVNTALYGLGVMTQEILRKYPNLPIAGLYDRDLKTGTMFGKRMLDIENVREDNIQRIVITAGPASIKIIYERIEEICRESNIRLVDVYDRNLYEVYGREEVLEHPYFQVGEVDLKKAIDAHEVISFDIFDTLIMRKTFEPHDVFLIVEKKALENGIGLADFCSFRIQAEQSLIADIPNIYELYDEVQRLTGISDSQREQLLQMELDTEAELLVKRESVCRMLEYAHAQKKKVYLVSDMYIPQNVLESWLKERGITDYDGIFVSCEYHKPKVNGLYEVYRQSVKGQSFLHIGDNEIYDGIFAKQAGLDTFLIKSAVEMFRISALKNLENHMKTYSDRALVGLCLSELFSNPFGLYQSEGRVVAENLERAIAVGAGPILSAFVTWFIEEIKQEPCAGVLLGARDGYLVRELLDVYKKHHQCQLPPYLYFYTSRVACAIAGMKSYEDFLQIIRRPKDTTLRECIKERLGLSVEGTNEQDVYQEHEKQFHEVSDLLCERYRQYMAGLGIEAGKKYCFFDFVSSGTCLMLLKKNFNLNLKGKFFHRSFTGDRERAELDVDSFLKEKEGRIFGEYYMIFETILTSLESTFLGFDDLLHPVFEREKRGAAELEITAGMQEAVIRFFEQMQYMAVDNSISQTLVLEFVKLLNEKRMCIRDENKKLLRLYDSYESGTIKVFG